MTLVLDVAKIVEVQIGGGIAYTCSAGDVSLTNVRHLYVDDEGNPVESVTAESAYLIDEGQEIVVVPQTEVIAVRVAK